MLAGNGTSAVKNVATASGALYATAANGEPQFGTLPVAQGGTGATTAADARTNLGAAASSHSHDASADLTGQVPIANGGTGASTAAGALSNLGALPFSSGVFDVGGISAYLLFKTTAIASFAPPTGVSACMVLDTSDNGLYWYTS